MANRANGCLGRHARAGRHDVGSRVDDSTFECGLATPTQKEPANGLSKANSRLLTSGNLNSGIQIPSDPCISVDILVKYAKARLDSRALAAVNWRVPRAIERRPFGGGVFQNIIVQKYLCFDA